MKCEKCEMWQKRNRNAILNRANYYYKNDKERLGEQARNKYRDLSEEEKNKKGRIRKKQISYYVWRKETKTKRISKRLPWG